MIQDSARSLSERIKEFDIARTAVVSRVATLLARFDQVSHAISMAMLSSVTGAFGSPPDVATRGIGAELQARLVALRNLGFGIGTEIEWVLRIAASMICLRQADLELYLEEVPHLDRTSIWHTLESAIAEEGARQIVEESLASLAKLAGAALPVTAIAMGIVEAGQRIREKVRAMDAHYERSPLDAMLEFAQLTHDEQRVIDDVVGLLDRADSCMAEVVDDLTRAA